MPDFGTYSPFKMLLLIVLCAYDGGWQDKFVELVLSFTFSWVPGIELRLTWLA